MRWLWIFHGVVSRMVAVHGLSMTDTSQQQPPPSLSLRPRVISLNVMVAGLSGLGKTTTCEALLQSWIQQEQQISLKPSNVQPKSLLPKSFLPRVTKVVDPSRQFERYDERTNTALRVRIIDTPGFGNRVDHRDAVRPIQQYMHRCRGRQFRAEMSSWRLPDKAVHACDDLVHVCLYFLSPGRFLEIDAYFLKQIQKEVSIIPVIAKADTLTNEELTAYRAALVQAFAKLEIVPYDIDVSPQTRQKTTTVTNNHNTTTTNHIANETALPIPYSRGRRSGEALGVVARDGSYPWGSIRSMDPIHSDLVCIRDLLLSQHTETFVELARQMYGVYRTRRIQRRQVADVLKILALGLLTAQALGVNIPFLKNRFSLHALWSQCVQWWQVVSTVVKQSWVSLLTRQHIISSDVIATDSALPSVTEALAAEETVRRGWFGKK